MSMVDVVLPLRVTFTPVVDPVVNCDKPDPDGTAIDVLPFPVTVSLPAVTLT